MRGEKITRLFALKTNLKEEDSINLLCLVSFLTLNTWMWEAASKGPNEARSQKS